jgi:hypothetical protein
MTIKVRTTTIRARTITIKARTGAAIPLASYVGLAS